MTTSTTTSNAIRNFYVDGLIHPHFSFFRRPDGGWVMAGNPGLVGDDWEFDSPLSLQPGETPEEWMALYFGDKWR